MNRYNSSARSTRESRDKVVVKDVHDYENGLYIIKHGISDVRASSAKSYQIGDIGKASDFSFHDFGLPWYRHIYLFLEEFGTIERSGPKAEIPKSVWLGGEYTLVFKRDVEPFERGMIEAFAFELSKCMKILPAHEEIRGVIVPARIIPIRPTVEELENDWWMHDALFQTAQIFQHLVDKFEYECDILIGETKRSQPPPGYLNKRPLWRALVREQVKIIADRYDKVDPTRIARESKNNLASRIVEHFKDNPQYADGADSPLGGKRYPSINTATTYITEYLEQTYPHFYPPRNPK